MVVSDRPCLVTQCGTNLPRKRHPGRAGSKKCHIAVIEELGTQESGRQHGRPEACPLPEASRRTTIA